MKVTGKQLLVLMDTCRFWVGYCRSKGVNRIVVPYPHGLEKTEEVLNSILLSAVEEIAVEKDSE